MTTLAFDPQAHRYDIYYLFDVRDGNPNGDPDAGNLPRQDPETNQGLVSDVSMKRRIRDWVAAAKGDVSPHRIYVSRQSEGGKPLEAAHVEAFDAIGASGDEKDKVRIKAGPAQQSAQAWLCEHFFDIRTFGGVLAGKIANAGHVTGPVQVVSPRSIDAIVVDAQGITRVAKSSEARAEATAGTTELGSKAMTYYGLYGGPIFVTPVHARHTGFSGDDMELVMTALSDLFQIDRTASRGEMSVCGLYVFEHDSPMGNARASDLFGRIAVRLREGVSTPRAFRDYEVTVDDADLPTGVRLYRLVA